MTGEPPVGRNSEAYSAIFSLLVFEVGLWIGRNRPFLAGITSPLIPALSTALILVGILAHEGAHS
jgi:hypothetical protein